MLLFHKGGALSGVARHLVGAPGLLAFPDLALYHPLADAQAQGVDRGILGQREGVDRLDPVGGGIGEALRLRQRLDAPILFLTARDAEVDRVVGLEIGGDDYVVKPFSPRELVARRSPWTKPPCARATMTAPWR